MSQKVLKSRLALILIGIVSISSILVLLAILLNGLLILGKTLLAVKLSIPFLSRVSILITLLLLSLFLYIAKESRWQFFYGLTEMSAGLLANWNAISQLESAQGSFFSKFAILLGGLYLSGRGIANFAEGIEKISPRIFRFVFYAGIKSARKSTAGTIKKEGPRLFVRKHLQIILEETQLNAQEIKIKKRESNIIKWTRIGKLNKYTKENFQIEWADGSKEKIIITDQLQWWYKWLVLEIKPGHHLLFDFSESDFKRRLLNASRLGQ